MEASVPESLSAHLAATATPQKPFRWNRSAWEPVVTDITGGADMLASLPRTIDRTAILGYVSDGISNDQILPAFISTMIWGYGDSGYGPTRVRWILTGTRTDSYHAAVRTDLAARLQKSVEKVRVHGPVEGFRYLNNEGRIKYLAGPFFTKWLYFASAENSPDDPKAAPIFDQRVRDWLRHEARVDLRTNWTNDYERYVQLLAAWGKQYDRTPVQVEKEIFTLATGRG